MARRLFSLFLAALLLGSFLILPASAEDTSLDGYMDFTTRYSISSSAPISSSSLGFTIPRSSATGSVTIYDSSTLRIYSRFSPSLIEVTPNDLNSAFGGASALYFSFYYGVDQRGGTLEWDYAGSGLSASTWDAYWFDGSNVQHEVDSFSVSSFTPGTTGYNSPGYVVSARANLDDGGYLTSFSLLRDSYQTDYIYSTSRSSSGTSNVAFSSDLYLYVPSISFVITQSDETLVQLEEIAQGIVQNNSILSAFYGDVISILNSMYSRMGDMLSAQNLANQYLSSIATYLQSIDVTTSNVYSLLSTYLHYLQEIAETSEDILAELEIFHNDFMTKLDLLIATVSQESDDIQAKMEEIYEQLIQWLDSQFSQSVNDSFDSTNDDLSQGITDSEAIEQQWTGSLSDTWGDTGISNFAFDASLTSAFMWVSSWFSSIYNAFGIYGAVILLPSIVGLCMLLLGMLRSGRLTGRGGDDGA